MRSALSELQNIGLTKGEAKIYLTLLEIGSSAVGAIAKRSSVSYANTYLVLSRLIEKGLASFIIRSKTKYFQPVSPQNLYEYLEKKEKTLRLQKRRMERLVPQLEKTASRNVEEAEIFVGFKSLRTAYQKLVSERSAEWLFFYVSTPEYDEESNVFFLGMRKFFRQVGVPIKGISNEPYRGSPITKEPFIKMRYVVFPLSGTIDIYGNKIFIISWSKRPLGFLITSANVANDMRDYFYSVWKIAKK